MKKKDEWITQSEAAGLLGLTLAGVNQLVRRGAVASENIYGKRLVSRASVLAYVPRAKRTKKAASKKTASKKK